MRKLTAHLAALLGGLMLTTACSDTIRIPDKEIYEREFMKNFGSIDPSHDWNLITRGEVTVTTADNSLVEILAVADKNTTLAGRFDNISGTQTLQFDMPSSTQRIIVKSGGTVQFTYPNGSVDFTGATSRAENTDRTPTVTEEIGYLWHPEYVTAFTSILPEHASGDGKAHSAVPSCEALNNTKVSGDFMFVSDGSPFEFYPMYWNTSVRNTLGVYWVNDDGSISHKDIFDNNLLNAQGERTVHNMFSRSTSERLLVTHRTYEGSRQVPQSGEYVVTFNQPVEVNDPTKTDLVIRNMIYALTWTESKTNEAHAFHYDRIEGKNVYYTFDGNFQPDGSYEFYISRDAFRRKSADSSTNPVLLAEDMTYRNTFANFGKPKVRDINFNFETSPKGIITFHFDRTYNLGTGNVTIDGKEVAATHSSNTFTIKDYTIERYGEHTFTIPAGYVKNKTTSDPNDSETYTFAVIGPEVIDMSYKLNDDKKSGTITVKFNIPVENKTGINDIDGLTVKGPTVSDDGLTATFTFTGSENSTYLFNVNKGTFQKKGDKNFTTLQDYTYRIETGAPVVTPTPQTPVATLSYELESAKSLSGTVTAVFDMDVTQMSSAATLGTNSLTGTLATDRRTATYPFTVTAAGDYSFTLPADAYRSAEGKGCESKTLAVTVVGPGTTTATGEVTHIQLNSGISKVGDNVLATNAYDSDLTLVVNNLSAGNMAFTASNWKITDNSKEINLSTQLMIKSSPTGTVNTSTANITPLLTVKKRMDVTFYWINDQNGSTNNLYLAGYNGSEAPTGEEKVAVGTGSWKNDADKIYTIYAVTFKSLSPGQYIAYISDKPRTSGEGKIGQIGGVSYSLVTTQAAVARNKRKSLRGSSSDKVDRNYSNITTYALPGVNLSAPSASRSTDPELDALLERKYDSEEAIIADGFVRESVTGNNISSITKGDGIEDIVTYKISVTFPEDTKFGFYIRNNHGAVNLNSHAYYNYSMASRNQYEPNSFFNSLDGTDKYKYVDGWNKQYNEQTVKESRKFSTAATYTVDIEGREFRYFSFEDYVDCDFNDIVFMVAPTTESEVVNLEVSTNPYIFAVEDLGASLTSDFDFNDVVFGVEHVADEEYAFVTMLAAAGANEAELWFNNERVDGTGDNQEIVSGPNVGGKLSDVNSWFGIDNPSTIINANGGYEHGFNNLTTVKIKVGKDFLLSHDLYDDSPTEEGFHIRVKRDDGRYYTSITRPTEAGEMPHILVIPSTIIWLWPRETTPIHEVYIGGGKDPDGADINSFTDWVSNRDKSNWYHYAPDREKVKSHTWNGTEAAKEYFNRKKE